MVTWSTWIPRSVSSSSTSRYDNAKRRYQRTASTMTSGGKQKPAKAERVRGEGRRRRGRIPIVCLLDPDHSICNSASRRAKGSPRAFSANGSAAQEPSTLRPSPGSVHPGRHVHPLLPGVAVATRQGRGGPAWLGARVAVRARRRGPAARRRPARRGRGRAARRPSWPAGRRPARQAGRLPLDDVVAADLGAARHGRAVATPGGGPGGRPAGRGPHPAGDQRPVPAAARRGRAGGRPGAAAPRGRGDRQGLPGPDGRGDQEQGRRQTLSGAATAGG